MHPKSFFQNLREVEPGYCFVLMPFAKGFDRVWAAIQNALEDYKCERADSPLGGGIITEKILRGIARADVVIADLTKGRPNVFYELGIAHMVKASEKVVMIAQRKGDIPFDVNVYTCSFYEPSPIGLRKLKRELVKLVKAVAEETFYFYVSGGQRFRWDDKFRPLRGSDGFLYSFRMSKVILGQDSVSYQLDTFRYAVGRTPQPVQTGTDELRREQTRCIPNIPWRLKFERVEEFEQEDKALICVIPDYAESQSATPAGSEGQPNTGCS